MAKKTKYVPVKISGIITQIAKETELKGYTEGVIEAFLPGDEKLQMWTTKQEKEWIAQNNKRMEAICKFLNENKL